MRICFLIDVLHYWLRLCKYCASIHTDRDIRKMQYSLLRENHVIEKGMSMRHPKHGFGQAKVSALLTRLDRYHHLYGHEDASFLIYPLSTIKSYIAFQKLDSVVIPEIEQAFNELCDKVGVSEQSLSLPAGIEMTEANVLRDSAKGDFQNLLYSRHSIRYFKENAPQKETLDRALTLASRTPSACNRQAWHTHIYFGEDAHELLQMQGGCNGFCNDIPCCIVVTADMKGFLAHEPFQCFVDGGLYAQNLINALHYVGLGSIPLSCGFHDRQLQGTKRRFQIPDNEVLIVIIGTGEMFDDVKIASSTRQDVRKTNVYHK